LIIAIDGPAGVGKSTVAKAVAKRLSYLYLDTGALYRAVAWKVQASLLDAGDREAVARMLAQTRIDMEPHAERPRVFVDGHDVTGEIRTPSVSALASVVSAVPAVREWLLPVQRRIGARGGVVVEGRDIGTCVFPGADVKFFLDADPAVRAARRHRELVGAVEHVGVAGTQVELERRDARDRTRAVAPLVQAPDARLIDTSTLDVGQVVEQIMAEISSKL
jgi:cytidylate kinase